MKLERISIMAAFMWELVSVAISLFILWVILFVFIPYTWLWYTLLWTLGAITICTTFIYVPFLYLNSEYGLSDKVIVYKKGVLLKSTQILYRDRIAFVSVYSNPLTPILKVSSLVISAAGGTIRIIFLSSKRAEQIAKELAKDRL